MADGISVQELQKIFICEIDQYLGRLERKSRDISSFENSSVAPQVRRLSDKSEGGSVCLPDPSQLNEIRRVALDLAGGVLGRLSDHAALWGLEGDDVEEPAEMGTQRSRSAAARERCELEARCQELEAQVEHKSKEEADLIQRKNNILIHREFTERLRNIQDKMQAMQDTVEELEQKKSHAEQVEKQQQQEPSTAEMLLAGMTQEQEQDQEDQRCFEEKVEEGEQMVKRMRRHAAGA